MGIWYRKKTHKKFISEMKEKNPKIKFLTTYSGTHEQISCLCKTCGRIWSTQPHHLLRGTGCNRCNNNSQIPGEHHVFPCGCSGILPSRRGLSNLFAQYSGLGWHCRIDVILRNSKRAAHKFGYVSVDFKTPHSIIRNLMREKNCWNCGDSLNWGILKLGKTPHLHHDHENGKIWGFVHSSCNIKALQQKIDRLQREIEILKGQYV